MPHQESDQPTHATGYAVDAAIPISDVIRRRGALRDDELAMEVMGRLKVSQHESWLDRSKVWVRNILFCYGEQWIKWNEFGRRWLRKPPARERRFTSNLLLSRVAHKSARMTQSRPGFQAVSSNSDMSGRHGSQLSEYLLMDDWRRIRMGTSRYLSVWDALMCGMGFLEIGFDPRGGRLITDYELERTPDGQTVRDAMGRPLKALNAHGKPIINSFAWEGAMFCRPLSPFQVFVPPHLDVPVLEDSPWIITTHWMGEEEMKLAFGLKGKLELGEPDPEFENVEPVGSFLQRFATTRGAHPRVHSGQHLVVRYQERATDVRGFEHGRNYYIVNNKLIHDDRSQWDDGRYGVFEFPWVPRRGQFWPHAWVTDQIEPQARYNQGLSHLLTYMSLMSNPNILVPKGSGIPQIISFNFRRYDYNPSAGPPQFWTPPPPNEAMFNMLDRTAQDLDRTGSTFPFSRGEPVPGVPAASYAQIMSDNDAQEDGPQIREHARSWEKLGEAMIELHRLYDPNEKILRVIGRRNQPQLVHFKKDDLPADVSIMVKETSMMSFMPSARIEQAKALAREGFFGPYADQAQVRRRLVEFIRSPELLEIGSPDDLLDDFLAELLSRLIEKGQDVEPPPLSEHPLLMAMKGALAERLLHDDVFEWDPQTWARVAKFKQTVEQQIQAFEQQAEQQQEQEREDLFGLQARGEMLKSALRTRERVIGEAAKAGVGLFGQKPSRPGDDNGSREKRPPDSQG